MRPIKLTIQAFGPFAGQEEVCFDEFGVAPLFLINGPTGAGKSSILDAICYALYGETTGNERSGDQMRCDYADSQLITEAVFEFALGQKRYIVTRSPDQEVPKKRGEGFTRKAHAVTLVELKSDDSEVLLANKPSPVKKAIEELLGLEASQFRQVMVLPQGRFRELLLANSKDREAIFGQLFQTHIYTQIEKSLFDKAAGIRREKDQFDQQIKGALNVASLENEAQLKQELELTAPLVADHEKAYQAQQKVRDELKQQLVQGQQLVRKFNQRESLNQEFAVLNAQSEQVAAQKAHVKRALQARELTSSYQQFQSAAEQLKSTQDKLEKASQTLKLSESSLQQADQVAKLARKNAEQIPEKNKALFEAQSLERNLRTIAEHEAQRLAADQSVNAAKEQRTVLESRIAKGEIHVKEKRAELESMTVQVAQIDSKQWQVNALQQQIELRTKEQTLHSQLQTLLVEQSKVQANVTQAKTETEQSRRQANQLELQWHRNQAAILAATLEDDSPCPVCGSQSHPCPAEPQGDVVTKEQVDEARHVQQQRYDREVAATAALQKIEQQLTHVNDELQQVIKQLEGVVSLDELRQSKQALEAELEKLRTLNVAHHNDMLIKAEQKLLALREEYNKQLNVIEQAQQQQTRLQAELDALTQSLSPDLNTLDKVLAYKASLEQDIAQLTLAEQQAQQAWVNAQSQLSAARSTFESFTEQQQQWMNEVAKKQVVWDKELTESVFTSVEEYQQSLLDNQEREKLEASINEHESRLSRLQGQLEALNKELAEQIKPELDDIEHQVAQCQNAVNHAFEQFTQAKSKLDNLNQVTQKLQNLYSKNAQLEAQYQVIGTLSDIANGRTGAKVSLHRFVLGVLLDDVLIQASQRLQRMSKGRYVLRRKQERAKGNAGSGLDLMVEDGYTGKWRDVATLSGGESFMAALSLALGVSDVVQSYSGGVRLDTLFIDEGFGSLDPESLDLAIQTLVDLQQGGRTIGIISHVTELKEQISLRLDITPTRKGSSVALHK